MRQIIKTDKIIFILFLLYLLLPTTLLATDKVLKNQSTSDHVQLLTPAQVSILVNYWYRGNKRGNTLYLPCCLTNKIAEHFDKVSYEPRTVWFLSSRKAKIFFNKKEVTSVLKSVSKPRTSSEKEVGSNLVSRWCKFTCIVPGFFRISNPISADSYQWVYLRPVACDSPFLLNLNLYPRELPVTHFHKSLEVSAQWDWNFFGLLIARSLDEKGSWLDDQLFPSGASYGIYQNGSRGVTFCDLSNKIGSSFIRNSARVARTIYVNNVKFSNPLEEVSD